MSPGSRTGATRAGGSTRSADPRGTPRSARRAAAARRRGGRSVRRRPARARQEVRQPGGTNGAGGRRRGRPQACAARPRAGAARSRRLRERPARAQSIEDPRPGQLRRPEHRPLGPGRLGSTACSQRSRGHRHRPDLLDPRLPDNGVIAARLRGRRASRRGVSAAGRMCMRQGRHARAKQRGRWRPARHAMVASPF